jgi:DNA-binding response OmpR family regulator
MLEGLEENSSIPPCLVLVHSDVSFALATSQSLRRLGWDVYLATTASEARRLAGMLDAQVVVLDVNLPDESGWLTCEKLTALLPHVRVLLVSDRLDPRAEEFAHFVGATGLVSRKGGLPELLEAVSRPPALPAAS